MNRRRFLGILGGTAAHGSLPGGGDVLEGMLKSFIQRVSPNMSEIPDDVFQAAGGMMDQLSVIRHLGTAEHIQELCGKVSKWQILLREHGRLKSSFSQMVLEAGTGELTNAENFMQTFVRLFADVSKKYPQLRTAFESKEFLEAFLKKEVSCKNAVSEILDRMARHQGSSRPYTPIKVTDELRAEFTENFKILSSPPDEIRSKIEELTKQAEARLKNPALEKQLKKLDAANNMPTKVSFSAKPHGKGQEFKVKAKAKKREDRFLEPFAAKRELRALEEETPTSGTWSGKAKRKRDVQDRER